MVRPGQLFDPTALRAETALGAPHDYLDGVGAARLFGPGETVDSSTLAGVGIAVWALVGVLGIFAGHAVLGTLALLVLLGCAAPAPGAAPILLRTR